MENENKQTEPHIYHCFSHFNVYRKIFRYMDLEYFLCMLEKKSLFVPRKKIFEDCHESQLPWNRLFPILPVEHHLNDDALNNQISHTRSLWNDYKESSILLTSCWTLREEENYLMWKTYAKSNFSVRIETTIDEAVAAIMDDFFSIICGDICYEGYGSNDINTLLFSKSSYYKDEEEFRFYFFENKKEEDKCPNSKEINIDVQKLIKRVTFSPFINVTVVKSMISMIEQRHAFLRGKIFQSSINIKH